MQEIYGDLFESVKADAICITTNGFVNSQGANTMGRGCAGEAKYRWPGIQMRLGSLIRKGGNHVYLLTVTEGPLQSRRFLLRSDGWVKEHEVPYHIVSFPTKHHWREPSDLALITRSAEELVKLTNQQGWESVIIPRPGCGLGGLSWENEVRPLLAPVLDDRFFVISPF